MMKITKSNVNASQQYNYSTTGYSTFNNTVPFQQKSICQIKYENQISKQNNRSFIETMYRSGNTFKYNLSPPHQGTYRSYLQALENRARSMIPEIDFEKNRLNIFNTQCINLRIDLINDYRSLRRDMLDEVDNLQNKLTQNINIQKNTNKKTILEIKEINKEFVDSNNLVIELKKRINSLQLRIDGKKAYNSDGIPFLDTKIE